METILLTLIRIEGGGYHLGLNVYLNGKEAFLLVDTGASKTVLDKNQIEEFVKNPSIILLNEKSTGLGTNSMEIHATEILNLEIGSKKIENITLPLVDLSHVNETYEKLDLKKIQGVLGSDLLYMFKAKIDYNKLELTLI
jgi:predicted aspartyl protease